MNLTVFCFEDITVVLSKNTSTTFNTTGASGFFLWLLGDFFLFVLFGCGFFKFIFILFKAFILLLKNILRKDITTFLNFSTGRKGTHQKS